MDSEKRKRLFIGIACSPVEQATDLLLDLAGLAKRIQGLRTVAPENLHITLKFLGMIDDVHSGLIRQVMGRVVTAAPRLTLQLRGIGFFRSAIWLGVEPQADLVALARRLDQALEITGVPGEGKPFVPHVTIARLKPGTRLKMSALQERYGNRVWGRLQVDTVQLYESLTLPEGARYRVLDSVPLSGSSTLPAD